MKKRFILIGLTLLFIAGCGETITGAARDVKRVGKSFKSIFFRDGS
ncbi:MAG: hypothetical protein PHQ52_05105 [Candidatus Omnitrophica bacterium]|nr:hypothetical protein [Candidatus Omnitrophota bacterium]